MKTINHRKSRKPTGKWARYVRELRERIEGVGPDGKPIMTQADFAKLFQSAPITCSRWELGKQDPPAPVLERLSLVAGTLGYRDLEMVFNAGQPNEAAIARKDRNVVSLLACLMRWKQVTGTSPGNREADIYRIGQAVFEVARTIVLDAAGSERAKDDLARKILIAEMTRLVQEIHNEEHQVFSPALRAMGIAMYSHGQVDFEQLNRARAEFARQAGQAELEAMREDEEN